MCYWSLPDLNSLATNYVASEFELSPFSIALILSTLTFWAEKENWGGADFVNGLTDTERDEIDALVSDLSKVLIDA